MANLICSRLTRTLGVLAAATLLGASGLAAQTGSIAGRVIDARSGQTIPAAQVFISDLDIGVLTQQNGSYILLNVPVGNQTVTVQRIGYGEQSQTVQVQAGQTAVLDFRISEEALQLQEVVVTGTAGGTQRRALGNSIETMSASDLTERSAVTSMQNLMTARTPGLRMNRGTGQVGSGGGITIRGVSSVSLGSQPLIYVDGVRVNNDATVGPRTGDGTSRSALDDLNPDDIESIEVIKGPSAATLYGTEASAGVIQIITKRGSVGAPQFEFEIQEGSNFMRDPQGTLGTQYYCASATKQTQCPVNLITPYYMYDEASDFIRGTGRFANVDPNAPNFNVADHYEPLSRSGNLFQNGLDQRYNMSVRGGTDQVRYYVGGTFQDQVGIVNYQTNNQKAIRANLTVLFGDNVNVDVSTGYSQGDTRFMTVRSEGGVWHQLVWSHGDKLPGAVPDNPATPTVNENLGGSYLGFQERWPQAYENTNVSRQFTRFTGSVTTTHNVGQWFNQKLTFGIDRGADTNTEYIPGNADFPRAAQGSVDYGRPLTENVTVDYGASAKYQVTDAFGTTTSVGAQYYYKYLENVDNYGAGFPTSVQTVISQTELGQRTVDFESIENKELGFYAQEELSYNDRMFFTAAVRADDNSAFGANFKAQYYPKLSASWVVSDEPFWSVGAINSFRLRGSWGKSGRQPSTFAAQTLYETFIGPFGNGLVPTDVGNPDVGPEVSTELEVGADFALFDDRISGEFSYYNTTTNDLLVNQSLSPSTGFTGNRQTNLGEMKNHGWEASLSARVYESDDVAFDLDLSGDYTINEITSLGEGVLGTGNFQIGWPYPNVATDYYLKSASLNSAGTGLDNSSVMCDGGRPAVAGGPNILQGGQTIPCSDYNDFGILLGPSYPKYSFHVAPTVTLFQDLQVFALAEGQYGRWLASVDAQYACGVYKNCYQAVAGTYPLQLAGGLAGPYGDDRYQGRYPSDFWKLRELGARYSLPSDLVSRIGADRASLSLSVNNMWVLWQKTKTDLSGNPIYDPDYAVNGDDPSAVALWEMPSIASFNASLRVTF